MRLLIALFVVYVIYSLQLRLYRKYWDSGLKVDLKFSKSVVPFGEKVELVEVIEKRQGLKVACLEGIAYRNGWISEEKMRELAKPMLKNQYGQYLLKVIDEMKEEVNSRTLTQD